MDEQNQLERRKFGDEGIKEEEEEDEQQQQQQQQQPEDGEE